MGLLVLVMIIMKFCKVSIINKKLQKLWEFWLVINFKPCIEIILVKIVGYKMGICKSSLERKKIVKVFKTLDIKKAKKLAKAENL
jgi:sulfur relay (sulfurtransferase) DsrC/TusE family protein